MKRIILFLLISFTVYAQDVINIATEDYGALTSKDKNAIEIKLPVKTNVDEISLSFKPNKGKIIILAKEDKKEKEIASLIINETEKDVSFKLQKLFLKDVRVIFVPDDPTKPLVLYTYAFNIVDSKTIQFYTSLQKSISVAGGEVSAAAGSNNTAPQQISNPVIPNVLPTEYTVSRASL